MVRSGGQNEGGRGPGSRGTKGLHLPIWRPTWFKEGEPLILKGQQATGTHPCPPPQAHAFHNHTPWGSMKGGGGATCWAALSPCRLSLFKPQPWCSRGTGFCSKPLDLRHEKNSTRWPGGCPPTQSVGCTPPEQRPGAPRGAGRVTRHRAEACSAHWLWSGRAQEPRRAVSLSASPED